MTPLACHNEIPVLESRILHKTVTTSKHANDSNNTKHKQCGRGCYTRVPIPGLLYEDAPKAKQERTWSGNGQLRQVSALARGTCNKPAKTNEDTP